MVLGRSINGTYAGEASDYKRGDDGLLAVPEGPLAAPQLGRGERFQETPSKR